MNKLYIIIFILIILIILNIIYNNDFKISLYNEKYIRNQYNINQKVTKYFNLLYNTNINKTVDDLFKLTVLYTDKLKEANIDYKLIKNPNCPKLNNDFYSCMTCCPNCVYDTPGIIWNYKIIKYKAIPSNTMVEITHCSSGSTPTEEVVSAWFYYTTGSNIWINIGKTMAFQDHREAILYFLGQDYLNKFNDCKGKHWGCQKHFTDLFTKIRNTTTLDTIQFLDHLDSRCALSQGDKQANPIEIVNVRTSGSKSLPKLNYQTFYNGKFMACDKVKQGNCLQCKNNIL